MAPPTPYSGVFMRLYWAMTSSGDCPVTRLVTAEDLALAAFEIKQAALWRRPG